MAGCVGRIGENHAAPRRSRKCATRRGRTPAQEFPGQGCGPGCAGLELSAHKNGALSHKIAGRSARPLPSRHTNDSRWCVMHIARTRPGSTRVPTASAMAPCVAVDHCSASCSCHAGRGCSVCKGRAAWATTWPTSSWMTALAAVVEQSTAMTSRAPPLTCLATR